LTVYNQHAAPCGVPPHVLGGAGRGYVGYFENSFGEQWIFTFDRETQQGLLRGGDIGWDQVCEVTGGRADVRLGQEETLWLAACWNAATIGLPASH
jgi:hypothetical protein